MTQATFSHSLHTLRNIEWHWQQVLDVALPAAVGLPEWKKPDLGELGKWFVGEETRHKWFGEWLNDRSRQDFNISVINYAIERAGIFITLSSACQTIGQACEAKIKGQLLKDRKITIVFILINLENNEIYIVQRGMNEFSKYSMRHEFCKGPSTEMSVMEYSIIHIYKIYYIFQLKCYFANFNI